jgi:uncharacterized protein (DUF305 family)
MYSFIKTAAIAALALLASANAAEEGGHDHGYETGVDCKPCADTTGDCDVVVKINFFASETGYFAIDGCEGVNPTLHLTIGRTYLFDQSDKSNWYHLIGFAYEPDGAHVAVDELEPGIAPGNSTCADTFSCPAPMYFMAGNYAGVYSNNPDLVEIPEEPSDDFGLNEVEPRFFHPLGEWEGYGAFVTYLNFDTTFDEDIFYFCHVHAGMSARIKLLDADGNMLNTENTPEIPYEYAEIDGFDFDCGTYNLTDYEDVEDGTCPEVFVCEDGATETSQYAKCVQAMNCHMMASMTTNAVGRSALFCHQMIPHHQNAVNMAKALIHAHDFECDLSGPAEEGAEQPWECELSPILYDIINVQNSQIIEMQGALEQLGENEYENCEVEFQAPGSMTDVSKRRLAEPDFMKHGTQRKAEECAFASGIDCKPCDGTDGVCDVIVKVNLLASATGYYEIDGCEGVNPTLHLEVGRTYQFDQTDKSNWYHLIGFAYEADGAHVGVDELEPGIAPGDSGCGETFSCPAPMYFRDGEYTGVYSNIESLVDVTGGEDDFGLDAVEPEFFLPLADWVEKGAYVTALNFDDENFDEDIFYFCHVHSGMTGRIKLVGSDGSKKSEADTPLIPYDYDCVSSFDGDCGTFGTDQFKPEDNPQCPDRFVCFDGAGTIGEMAGCVNAMNCAMLTGMTVFYGDEGKDEKVNDTILFLREMIPHHQNAVNMAKNLLKSGEVNCSLDAPVEEGEEVSTACVLDPIVRSIINTQNSQIITMYGLLDGFDVDKPEDKICTIAEDGTMEDGTMSDASGVESLFGVSVALLAGLAL